MIRTGSDRDGRRAALRVALTIVCSTVVAATANAQLVSLRIAPPVGQTMRMRLDQRVEMTGTARLPGGDSTATVITTLLVVSRTFVERREGDATILLASTDSVAASSTGADSATLALETRRALKGKRVRLRVAPDGATEVAEDPAGGGGADLNALFSQMPATLPATPVEVGRSWSRAMVAPIGPDASGKGGGKVQATFRLDSLSRNNELAFVSIVGTLSRPQAPKDAWGTMAMSGSLNGSFVVDRRMGWISEARMSYIVRSVVTPSSGSQDDAMRFRMKVTQWIRVVP